MRAKVIAILLIFLPVLVSAQIGERTKDKAEDKANNRVDRKIDKGIDKSLDAIEGLFKKKPKKDKESDESAEKDSDVSVDNARKSGVSSSSLEKEYKFDHQVDMLIQTFDKKGRAEDPISMQMYFSDDEPNMGVQTSMEGANSVIITDMEKQKTTVLTDVGGMKMAMSIKVDPSIYETDETTVEADMPDFTRTGKTKTIAGYECEQYLINDDNMEAEYWVTDDTDIAIYKGLMAMSGQQGNKSTLPETYPQGMMMEMISVDKKSKVKTVMTVTKIHENISKTISTEGYKEMNLGGN